MRFPYMSPNPLQNVSDLKYIELREGVNGMASALAGQHALVSGGGRGIGRAIASALRQAGAI